MTITIEILENRPGSLDWTIQADALTTRLEQEGAKLAVDAVVGAIRQHRQMRGMDCVTPECHVLNFPNHRG